MGLTIFSANALSAKEVRRGFLIEALDAMGVLLMMPSIIVKQKAPPKRQSKVLNGIEWKMPEAGVMLAFAFYLLDQPNSSGKVEIHPDGEHGKRFDIRGWLEKAGFELVAPMGSTTYGGSYSRGNQSISVDLRPGIGDVVGKIGGITIVAEAKGGIVNSKHAGQVSRLRSGLREIIGTLMGRPGDGERNIAVVPYHSETEKWGARLAPRCAKAGIEIALVHQDGGIAFVSVADVDSPQCK